MAEGRSQSQQDESGKVTAWQAVNGNYTTSVSPPSTSARPQWQGNELNGRPVVRFDGVDDALTSVTGMADVSQDFTVFVVHRRQAQTPGGAGVVSFSTDMPWGSQTPAKTSTLSLSWNNAWSTPNQTLSAGIGLAEQSADPWDGKPRVEAAPHQAAWQVSTLVKANTTLLPPAQAWTNGVTFESDVTVRTQANGVIQQQTLQDLVQTYEGEAGSYALGRRTVDGSEASQGYLSGDIAEVLIYNRALSSEEQTQVEVYLTSRHALPSQTASLDLTSDFRYTGHYYHRKSGLHLAPYRAYDAEMAVWLNEDPIEESGGINLYGYVGNSPILIIDLLGLDLNYMNPGDSDFMYTQIAQKANGRFDVDGHGNPEEFYGWDKSKKDYVKISAKDLARIILNQEDYRAGDAVQLNACNTGNLDIAENYAEQLARELTKLSGKRTSVWAPDGLCQVRSKSSSAGSGWDIGNRAIETKNGKKVINDDNRKYHGFPSVTKRQR